MKYKLIRQIFEKGKIELDLVDLEGDHLLYGVDYEYDNNDSNEVLFNLDGIIIKAKEDPDDGYRSYMEELEVSFKKLKNSFPPIEVLGIVEHEDYITFYKNGSLPVLEVGTDNYDGYYPMFVGRWNPAGLSKDE